MISSWTEKPEPVSDFWQRYIDNVEAHKDLLDLLEEQIDEVEIFFTSLPDIKLSYRYSAGKWSPKEILGHLADTERVLSFRALSYARLDPTELPRFDEDLWVANSNADSRSLDDLLSDFASVRLATISLFTGLEEGSLTRIGKANGKEVSVIRQFYSIPGHVVHHLNVIKERYL
jgi:hypothetical protein